MHRTCAPQSQLAMWGHLAYFCCPSRELTLCQLTQHACQYIKAGTIKPINCHYINNLLLYTNHILYDACIIVTQSFRQNGDVLQAAQPKNYFDSSNMYTHLSLRCPRPPIVIFSRYYYIQGVHSEKTSRQ